MKTMLFLLICGMVFCLPYNKTPVPEEKADAGQTSVAATAAGEPDTIDFAGQIMPILKNRCNPCHFPGGKMYEAMPFDRAGTLKGHEEGVLKRIDDPEERKLIERFYAGIMAHG